MTSQNVHFLNMSLAFRQIHANYLLLTDGNSLFSLLGHGFYFTLHTRGHLGCRYDITLTNICHHVGTVAYGQNVSGKTRNKLWTMSCMLIIITIAVVYP